jgi:hypothetical protein
MGSIVSFSLMSPATVRPVGVSRKSSIRRKSGHASFTARPRARKRYACNSPARQSLRSGPCQRFAATLNDVPPGVPQSGQSNTRLATFIRNGSFRQDKRTRRSWMDKSGAFFIAVPGHRASKKSEQRRGIMLPAGKYDSSSLFTLFPGECWTRGSYATIAGHGRLGSDEPRRSRQLPLTPTLSRREKGKLADASPRSSRRGRRG